MLIGLTGKYCAGKNHVAAVLEKHGLPVLDVDKLGHIAIESQRDEIFSRFGDAVKNPDGSVNRRLLGEKVFTKKTELAALEAIVHPQANRLTLEWIASQNGKNCVINAALLHKSAVFGELSCILLVEAPFLTRLLRAKRRDRHSWAAVIRRLLSQKHFIPQYFAGNADIYKVKNPGLKQTGFLPGFAGSAGSTSFAENKAKLERRIGVILKTHGGF